MRDLATRSLNPADLASLTAFLVLLADADTEDRREHLARLRRWELTTVRSKMQSWLPTVVDLSIHQRRTIAQVTTRDIGLLEQLPEMLVDVSY